MGQSTSTISPSITSVSGTCKRKRDNGDLPDFDSNSYFTKRHKDTTYCNRNKARRTSGHYSRHGSIEDESTGEESSRPPQAHPLVCQTICANDTRTDKIRFQGHQTALCVFIPQAGKLSTSPKLAKASTQSSSASANVAFPSEITKKSKVVQTDTLNVSDRKRHFMYTPTDVMKDKMKNYVRDVCELFDGMGSDDCWLHPSPPPDRRNGRPTGTIQCRFLWKDSSGNHRLMVNVGFVLLIVQSQLSEEQKQGYVSESWHLSHLCGNWTCCNWRHMTVESGRINNSRNQCFPIHGYCWHKPPCMKRRKRRFLVTVDISNRIKSAINSVSGKGTATPDSQNSDFSAAVSDCGLCGRYILYCGTQRICSALTSITKSQKMLKKLESCTQPNDEVLEAITYLRNIVADLRREEEARDSAVAESWN